jgi:hypothetical protein
MSSGTSFEWVEEIGNYIAIPARFSFMHHSKYERITRFKWVSKGGFVVVVGTDHEFKQHSLDVYSPTGEKLSRASEVCTSWDALELICMATLMAIKVGEDDRDELVQRT